MARPRRAASAGLIAAVTVYATLFVYHLSGVPELVSIAVS